MVFSIHGYKAIITFCLEIMGGYATVHYKAMYVMFFPQLSN